MSTLAAPRDNTAARVALIATPIAALAALVLHLAGIGAGVLAASLLAAVLGVVALVLHLRAAPPAIVLDPPPATASGSPPSTAASETMSPPGDHTGLRLGPYTLERRMAGGGMGEIWEASHDTLVRPAALKVIKRPPGLERREERKWFERFRREAVVTGSLTSPHTVDLYDFGVAGGMFYLAMELLEGLTLRQLVERHGPLDEARVAYLIRQACHSLIEAHEGGVVHRDLKPDNLLVTRAGRDFDFLKVIDFGLVKELVGGPGKRRLTGQEGNLEPLTAYGARPGTPGYMAPEQIDGSGIDQRADIYALACVAYYALTGQPVFLGNEEAQLMFAHVEGEVEPPSARVGRPLHAGLEEVIMRCLAKNPLKRPPTMEALDEALAELRFDPPWTPARARKWWDERGGFPESADA